MKTYSCLSCGGEHIEKKEVEVCKSCVYVDLAGCESPCLLCVKGSNKLIDTQNAPNEKDISEMKCRFNIEQIRSTIKEIYPNMEELEVNYHANHIQDNDLLKVTDDEAELEDVIRQQVENQ